MEDFITDAKLTSKFLKLQLERCHKWRPLSKESIEDITGWSN